MRSLLLPRPKEGPVIHSFDGRKPSLLIHDEQVRSAGSHVAPAAPLLWVPLVIISLLDGRIDFGGDSQFGGGLLYIGNSTAKLDWVHRQILLSRPQDKIKRNIWELQLSLAILVYIFLQCVFLFLPPRRGRLSLPNCDVDVRLRGEGRRQRRGSARGR